MPVLTKFLILKHINMLEKCSGIVLKVLTSGNILYALYTLKMEQHPGVDARITL